MGLASFCAGRVIPLSRARTMPDPGPTSQGPGGTMPSGPSVAVPILVLAGILAAFALGDDAAAIPVPVACVGAIVAAAFALGDDAAAIPVLVIGVGMRLGQAGGRIALALGDHAPAIP